MNPWMIILFVTAGVVFGLDYLIRRKNGRTIHRKRKSV